MKKEETHISDVVEDKKKELVVILEIISVVKFH